MSDRNDGDDGQYTRRPSWLFIISVLLALLFACLGLLLIFGRLPGLEPVAAVPATPDELQARAGFVLLWPIDLPAQATFASATIGQWTASLPVTPDAAEPGNAWPPGRAVAGPVAVQAASSSAELMPLAAQTGRSVDLIWSGAPQPDLEPLLRLSQAPAAAASPVGQPVRLRGQAGWLKTVAFTYQDGSGGQRLGYEVRLWWIEGGSAISLTSRTLPVEEVTRIAEALQPVPAPLRAVYQEQPAAERQGSMLVAGQVDGFPVLSVTFLGDAGIFLLRSQAGWFAFINEDPHLGHATAWNHAEQIFLSPAHGERYDWRGRCIGGPCPRGLDRYPVEVRDDRVSIDTSKRIQGPARADATPVSALERLRHQILHWLGFAPPGQPTAPPQARPVWP